MFHDYIKIGAYLILACGGILKTLHQQELGDTFIAIAGLLGASAYNGKVNLR